MASRLVLVIFSVPSVMAVTAARRFPAKSMCAALVLLRANEPSQMRNRHSGVLFLDNPPDRTSQAGSTSLRRTLVN